MSPERWKKIDEIVQRALDLRSEDRPAYLDSECRGDPALRREAESLIAYQEDASGFLESPAVKDAALLMLDARAESLEGRTVSHYKLARKIGEGGMGAVFLAHDTSLDRQVAIKFISLDSAEDSVAKKRMVREARAAAKLDHLNICSVYEVAEQDGLTYIVMQYVEGETLSERIGRRPLEIKEAIDIAVQVADALAEAHSRGIIHRDIKPANIMLTSRGQAKVLDFGLAKMVRRESVAGSEVATESLMSGPGMIAGTVPYMSPEQLRGEAIDARSDIFSFGVVMYEMITGQQPFESDSAAEIISAILTRDPPSLAQYSPDAPAELQRIIRKALRKDREERYQIMKELLLDLKSLKQEIEDEAKIERSAQPGSNTRPKIETDTERAADSSASKAEHLVDRVKRYKKGAVFILIALSLAAAGAFYVLFKSPPQKPAAPTAAMSIRRLTTTGKAMHAVISPDGKYVAYVKDEGGQQSLWLIVVAANSEERVVPPAEIDYKGLTFSRDGNFIYYVRVDQDNTTGALYQKPILGGEARKLLINIGSPITLSPDGKRLAFVRGSLSQKESALVVANVDGTEEKKLAAHNDPDSFSLRGPAWSPDGQLIACGFVSYTGTAYTMVVGVRVADGAEQPITAQRWNSSYHIERVAWLSDGSGLIMSTTERGRNPTSPQIWRLSYPENEARRVTHDLNGYTDISLTADSYTLAALRADQLINIWIVHGGDASRAKQITFGSGRWDGVEGLAWTADGRIVYLSDTGSGIHLWMMAKDGSGNKQLTFTSYLNIHPAISPDGRYIVWDAHSDTGIAHLWRMNIDGNNQKQLTDGAGEYFPQFSLDGNWIVYGIVDSVAGRMSLWKMPIDGGAPVQLTDKQSWAPAISPDGKLIACNYFDEATSQYKIAIISFEGGPPIKIFGPLGRFIRPIRWTPDGRAVAYIVTRGGISNIWAQPIDGNPPKQLTEFKDQLIFNFAWSHDGRQLALSRGLVNRDVVLINEF